MAKISTVRETAVEGTQELEPENLSSSPTPPFNNFVHTYHTHGIVIGLVIP